MPDESAARRLLYELVSIPSPSGGERRAVEFLVDAMRRLGFDRAYCDGAGNAVGIRRSGGGEIRRSVVLLGHIDTFPGQLAVRDAGGWLAGRGTVDAKGPLATFVMSAATAQLSPGLEVVVVGAVEEESATSKGARHAAGQFRPGWCIIGEPSGWDAVTLGYKGRLLVDYRLDQPEGHTAGPVQGVIDQAFTWWQQVLALAAEYNRGRTGLFDQLLPSLRHIHSSSDGVTSRLEAQGAFRLPPDFDIAGFQRQVTGAAAPAQVRCHAYETAYQTGRQNELVTRFSGALRQVGVRPKFKLKTGTCDMNVVGPIWNCPIVAYGPGDSSLDHTPEERICWLDYSRAIGVLRSVLESA